MPAPRRDTSPEPALRPEPAAGRGGLVPDLGAALAGVLLVVAAALVGRALVADGVNIFLGFPPLLASWLPYVGPGTPAAVVVGALAQRLSWRPLLGVGYAAAVGWTLSLEALCQPLLRIFVITPPAVDLQ